MIEDLDGGDVSPSRARIVSAISLVLVLATLIGWAALQSPELRGPYATPDPRARRDLTEHASPRPTPSLYVLQYLHPVTAASGVSCMVGQSQQSRIGYGFVGGRSVTLVRELSVNVWISGGSCQPYVSSPVWRFAP